MKKGPCLAPSTLLAAQVGTASHGGAIRRSCAPTMCDHLVASHSDPAPAADFKRNERRVAPTVEPFVSSMGCSCLETALRHRSARPQDSTALATALACLTEAARKATLRCRQEHSATERPIQCS